MVTGLAAIILVVAHLFGPKRHGPVKDTPYESGMPPVMDTQRRFNIRFYIVAMLFMLFDVEVIFLWPWATAFYRAAAEGVTVPLESGDWAGKGFLLVGMAIFFALLVFGLVYEWKRGAFQWD
jgi:NADH-quinone oxidoreductase subunit A